MSDFKFSCPACGQNILCDTTDAGKQMTCPGCNARIAVPEEAAGPAAVPLRTDTPPWPGYNATAVTPKTSRLAIASLVCSLLSLIMCLGWLPGIICGHLAKSRIRRDPSLKGIGLAKAGLLISYLILISEAGTAAVYVWRISAAMKQGYQDVRHNLATNNFIVVQTQSTTVSNSDEQIEPVLPGIVVTNHPPAEPVKPETVAAGKPKGEPAKSGWTSDLSKVSFPGHPVSGRLRGIDFAARTVSFRNGDLKIRSEDGIQLDVLRLDTSIEGEGYDIQSADNGNANPRVKLTWNEGGVVQTMTFNQGYGMKLQFNRAMNRTVSGKIYLCFPDDSKSWAAGTFEVKLPKPK